MTDATGTNAANVGSAYQRILVTLLQSAPIDFDVEAELAQLEADIRADERLQFGPAAR